MFGKLKGAEIWEACGTVRRDATAGKRPEFAIHTGAHQQKYKTTRGSGCWRRPAPGERRPIEEGRRLFI